MEPAYTGQSSFLRKQPLGTTTKDALLEHSCCFELCSMFLSQTAVMYTPAPGGAGYRNLVWQMTLSKTFLINVVAN